MFNFHCEKMSRNEFKVFQLSTFYKFKDFRALEFSFPNSKIFMNSRQAFYIVAVDSLNYKKYSFKFEVKLLFQK